MTENLTVPQSASSPAMTPQQKRLTTGSPLALYREMAVGSGSLAHFVSYELLTTLFTNLPGLLGFGARWLLFPHLFARTSGRAVFGRGMVIRNPNHIELGRKVLLDDYATLDARGEKSHITIGDHVTLGRFSALVARNATITLAAGVNIGSHCRLGTESKLTVGESTLIAAYCYIGPGNHQPGDDETPLIAREMEIKGGVRIGKNVWIGTRATILDGVTIGDGAIVGAHSLVREDVPAGAVVAGTPARRVK